jgi:hypothetical protein
MFTPDKHEIVAGLFAGASGFVLLARTVRCSGRIFCVDMNSGWRSNATLGEIVVADVLILWCSNVVNCCFYLLLKASRHAQETPDSFFTLFFHCGGHGRQSVHGCRPGQMPVGGPPPAMGSAPAAATNGMAARSRGNRAPATPRNPAPILPALPAPNDTSFYASNNVPHGRVEMVHYTTTAGVEKRMHIYLPPGYDADTDKHYPVLYLNHGATKMTAIGRRPISGRAVYWPDQLPTFQENIKPLLGDPNINDKFRMPIYFAAGETDIALLNSQKTLAVFNNYGIHIFWVMSSNGHEWLNWRRYLYQTAQITFPEDR